MTDDPHPETLDLDDDELPEPVACRLCGPVDPDAGGGHACPHPDGMPVDAEAEALAILNRSPAAAWDHRGRGFGGRDPWFEVIDVELEGWTFGALYRGFGFHRIDYAIAPDGRRWQAWVHPGEPRLAHAIAEHWDPPEPPRQPLLARLRELLADVRGGRP